MKKRIGLIFSIVAAVFVCAFLTGCSITNYKYADADSYSVGASSFAASEINAIDISWVNGEVNIVYSDVEEISVSETVTKGEMTSDFEMRYLLNDGKLMIKYAKSGRWRIDNFEKTLTVSLPADKSLTELDVDLASADFVADKIVCDKASIDTASGDVDIKTACVSDFRVDSASGDVSVKIENAESVSADTASGDITFDLINVDRVSVDSASGDVNITADHPSSIDIDTASGDVKIKLPDETGFRLKFDTASGDFDTDFTVTASGKSYVCGDGSVEINVDTASGSLDVNKR